MLNSFECAVGLAVNVVLNFQRSGAAPATKSGG
jgi:hypothetical protein